MYSNWSLATFLFSCEISATNSKENHPRFSANAPPLKSSPDLVFFSGVILFYIYIYIYIYISLGVVLIAYCAYDSNIVVSDMTCFFKISEPNSKENHSEFSVNTLP